MALYSLKDYSLNLIHIPSKNQDKTQKIEVLELILDLVNSSGNRTTKKFHIVPDTRQTLASAQAILNDGLNNAKKSQGKIEQRYYAPKIYLYIGITLSGSKNREEFQFTAHQS